MGVASDVLVSVPLAELHKVVQNTQQLLQHGTFTVSITTPGIGSPPEAGRIEAGVGDFRWPLGKHLPALKAADGIYSFALEHTKAEYLIVVLPKGELDKRLQSHFACMCVMHFTCMQVRNSKIVVLSICIQHWDVLDVGAASMHLASAPV
jgi:hypothetical protein